MKKASILVIDDECAIRELVSAILTGAGYSVDTAPSGTAGLDMIRKDRYQVVISDIKMPGINGMELLKLIKQIDPAIEVIIITGYASVENAVEALRSGAFDFLHKPFNVNEVLLAVERALGKIHLESTVALYEICKETFSTLDPEELAQRIAAAARRILRSDEAILLLSGENGGLAAAASDGVADPALRDSRATLAANILRKVVNGTGEEHFVCALPGDERIDSMPEANGIGALLLQTLQRKGKRLGAMMVVRTGASAHFQERDIPKAAIFASQASLAVENAALYRDVDRQIHAMKQMQVQLIQSEKMASIGQLAAGIAHEINNPIGFVNSNLSTLSEYVETMKNLIGGYRTLEEAVDAGETAKAREEAARAKTLRESSDLPFILEDIGMLLSESLDGVDRVKSIVLNLKDFSHVDDSEIKYADLNAGIESTLKIIWNELKYKAEVVRDLGKLPEIRCYPRQINQVLMNILVNAAHAIPKKGVITVQSRHEGNAVVIRIGDTGSGIKPEHLSRIFDPFFTTKDVGKGTGLGLSISYNIVKKHRGTIGVESEWRKGTLFTITLPLDGLPEQETGKEEKRG